MSIREVQSDARTIRVAFPASTAISQGDLLYWDAGNSVAKPATARTDLGAITLNQADFRSLFLGVAADQRLATETSTTPSSDRVVIAHGVFDADCASQTWSFGDLVGVDRSATPLNYAQQVNKVANRALAIGRVLKAEPNAVTKVRVLLSAFEYGYFLKPGPGTTQGSGVATLADAAATLTIASAQILNMVPTAARSVTLPAEAQSQGLAFLFTNNSAGAFSVTFLGSGGGSIKGNGVVPQNKTAILWSDGSAWNGLVSA